MALVTSMKRNRRPQSWPMLSLTEIACPPVPMRAAPCNTQHKRYTNIDAELQSESLQPLHPGITRDPDIAAGDSSDTGGRCWV